MGLYGGHNAELILDYGCGPANDIIGFIAYGNVKTVVGIDVSLKALQLAQHRLRLHGFTKKCELIWISDLAENIPLRDESVDFLICAGVLHHVSKPEHVLSEFQRVLTVAGTGVLMVYNRDSLWYHLYVPYIKQILEEKFSGLTTDEAFRETTDGPNCPISRPYSSEELGSLCRHAGLNVDFMGGYFTLICLDIYDRVKRGIIQPVDDPRLGKEHRKFLGELKEDDQGYPMHHGKHVGIGGVYKIWK